MHPDERRHRSGREPGRGPAAATESIPAGQEFAFSQSIEISAPTPWSLEDPYLYTVETLVETGGRVTDRYETPFGVRSFRFDGSGFSLNGTRVKINGVNLHHDFAGVGVALPDRVNTYRLEKLKEMGANAIRTSHNPPTAEVLDAADRLGILVLVENRHMGTSQDVLGTVESMVRRDRNHPSVIGWSMNNEGLRQGYEEAGRQLRAMHSTIKRLDARPTTGNVGPLTGATSPRRDFHGAGSHHSGGRDRREGIRSPELRRVSRRKSGPAHAGARRPATTLRRAASMWTTRRRATTARMTPRPRRPGAGSPKPTMSQAALSGTEWTTGGEPFPFDWPVITAQYGFMDTCAFPKDNYYYYQSSWSDETVLHLFPHWNEPPLTEDGTVEVRSFTNCESVELFLNGASQGRKDREPYAGLSWQVPWEAGSPGSPVLPRR